MSPEAIAAFIVIVVVSFIIARLVAEVDVSSRSELAVRTFFLGMAFSGLGVSIFFILVWFIGLFR